jgi:vacuolar-type H+-ATPase subunit I/STV1
MMHDAATAQRQHLITQLQQPDPTPQTTPQVPQTPAAQTPPADYWFIDQPTTTTASPVSAPATDNAGFAATAVVAPDSDITNLSGVVQAATPTEDEAAYVDVLKAANNQHRAADDHLKHIKTPAEIAAEEQRLAALAAQQQAQAAALAAQKAAEAEAAAAKAQVTSDTQAAIINLANNDDLDVATIARQANKQQAHKQQVRQMNGEVVIPLR